MATVCQGGQDLTKALIEKARDLRPDWYPGGDWMLCAVGLDPHWLVNPTRRAHQIRSPFPSQLSIIYKSKATVTSACGGRLFSVRLTLSLTNLPKNLSAGKITRLQNKLKKSLTPLRTDNTILISQHYVKMVVDAANAHAGCVSSTVAANLLGAKGMPKHLPLLHGGNSLICEFYRAVGRTGRSVSK